jgi:hypothetical protein
MMTFECSLAHLDFLSMFEGRPLLGEDLYGEEKIDLEWDDVTLHLGNIDLQEMEMDHHQGRETIESIKYKIRHHPISSTFDGSKIAQYQRDVCVYMTLLKDTPDPPYEGLYVNIYLRGPRYSSPMGWDRSLSMTTLELDNFPAPNKITAPTFTKPPREVASYITDRETRKQFLLKTAAS